MITKMTRYSIVLMSGDREKVLDRIRDIGLMDITRSSKPVDGKSSDLFSSASSLRSAMDRIQRDDFSRDEIWNALVAEREEARRQMAQRAVWGDFNASALSALAGKGYSMRFHCCPEKKFNGLWKEDFILEEIRREAGNVWFVTIAPSEGYSFPGSQYEVPSPDGTYSEASERLKAAESRISEREEQLRSEKDGLPRMQEQLRDTMVALDTYLASLASQGAAEDHISIFTGFAPTEDDATVCLALDSMDVCYISQAATVADNPPVKLHNNWFARNFETLTGMYGMPVYDEFDPTPVLAPFFLLFWAFCMGDAGYGLVLILIGLLLRSKIDIMGLRKHWRLVTTLGIGATVIGFFLATFFGINLTQVGWIPEGLKSLMLSGKLELGGSSYDVSMVAAIAVGVFHICLAMVIKGIGLTHRFGFKEAISTWGWIVLIVGGLLVAGTALAGVIDENVTRIAVIIIAAVSVLGIFIFNKPGRNPLINIGAGLWDTYGMATGILGDVLSYIRLYALGLAGGMLGSAFNDLGAMTLSDGVNTWQWIPFAVIVLLGHALNFAMSCLGAFVHPLRLTFVEYFKNSGYEGKGLEYKPLKNQ